MAITFYIDHALKLRPCFRRLFGNKNKIFTFKHLHIKRYNNFIPLDVLDSSGVNPYLPLDFVKTQQLQILLHNTQPWTVPQGKCLWSEKVFYAFELLKKCVVFSWHIRSLYLKQQQHDHTGERSPNTFNKEEHSIWITVNSPTVQLTNANSPAYKIE